MSTKQLVSSAYLARLFRRTPLTIFNWRRELGLPTTIIPGDKRPAIRHPLHDVKRWAKANGKPMYEDDNDERARTRIRLSAA